MHLSSGSTLSCDDGGNHRPRVVAWLVVLAGLVMSSCVGGSSTETVAPVTPGAVETPVVAATEVPTAEPVVLSEQAKIDAVVAAFDADPRPIELFAYDNLDAQVEGTTGIVSVTVCGWTGDTVFDEIYEARYRVSPNDAGDAVATFESSGQVRGDCTNSELIDSALEFTRDYETFWHEVVRDPRVFDRDAASEFWTTELTELNEPIIDGWIRDGLSYRESFFDANLPESAITDVLRRSYLSAGIGVMDIISCREVPQGFGLYRGDVLVDDFRGTDPKGPHAIVRHRVTRSGERWKLAGVIDRVWSDCLGFSDGWFEGINEFFPDPVAWERLQS